MDPLIFWAKSGDKDHPEGHPLLAHMLDAAAVARAILLREPDRTRQLLAKALNLDHDRALNFAAFTVGLHDLGKASADFQKKWPEGARRLQAAGLTYDKGALLDVPHGPVGAHLVRVLLPELGFPRRVARKLGDLIGAHHGTLATSKAKSQAAITLKAEIGPWDEARKTLTTILWETLKCPRPMTDDLSPEAALWLMGLTSFADWLASSTELFPYGRDPTNPKRYFNDALTLAEKALNDPRIRWQERTSLAPKPPPFNEVFPFPANTLQSSVAHALENVREPTLLILEAPMGGGKTEAALYAHLLLQAKHGHRGLYVAMPTQATGNAMFGRVKDFRAKFGGRPHDLQLVHGAAILKPEYLELRQVGEDEATTVQASEWFSAKKRALLTEYGVGTVDQALLGVLKVRHHFVRLWGLGNRTLVFDEVHAYDAYTSRLIAGLIRWMRALGSSVVLMSATLTRAQRTRLTDAWGANLPETEAPYPRLTLVSGESVKSIPISWPEEKTYQIAPAPRLAPELAEFALKKLGEEGAVALIVNTVDRAQALYQELKQLLKDGETLREGDSPIGWRAGETELYLIHARIPSRERQVREKAFLARFGKDGKRPKRALVVATQVIEQSLDLDFDLLITDLAPIDLVLQRAGRVHRHSRTPPAAHAEPRVLIAGLNEEPPDLESEHWNKVYASYPLYTSWHILRGRNAIRLPAEMEGLIEAAYAENTLAVLPDTINARANKALEEFRTRIEDTELEAANAVVDPLNRLLETLSSDRLAAELGLDDDEENPYTQRPLTRLGEPSITVVPLYQLEDGYFLDPSGRRPARIKGEASPAEAKALYAASLRVGRKDVVQELKNEETPPAWQKNGLLRNLKPLYLNAEGVARVGKTELRMDPELGLVYKRH